MVDFIYLRTVYVPQNICISKRTFIQKVLFIGRSLGEDNILNDFGTVCLQELDRRGLDMVIYTDSTQRLAYLRKAFYKAKLVITCILMNKYNTETLLSGDEGYLLAKKEQLTELLKSYDARD